MGFWTKNKIRNSEFLIFNFFVLLLSCISCTKVSTPKPYGYFRITPPDTAYIPFTPSLAGRVGESFYPYTFALSRNARVIPRKDVEEPYWINLYYPDLNATIHCSYKPVHGNLRELTNDALEFVYRNASFANAIPEREYTHPEAEVYGVLFDLEGNTASSCQFFITDSIGHFFRASVYCNCPPNADSLAPVYDYLRTDVIKMVETFEWKNTK
jgi:gliding motility-associated lipoprotein GldD